MTGLLDLGLVAENLRKRGIDAVHDFLYSPHGCVEGLGVGEEFFPLWELSFAENAIRLAQGDFEAILKSRQADWTVDCPVRIGTAVP
jgi:hypothetical protein